MTRPHALAALASVALSTAPIALGAQLPTLTAPRGALRFELGGVFQPTTEIRVDGARRPLGSLLGVGTLLDGGSTPLVGEVDTRLAAILGGSAPASVLGRIDATAEWQRGVGTIGLAYGITRRITAYATVPIVSVRTQVDFGFDTTGATLGINPADPALGTSAGATQTAAFFAEYDAALSELSTRVARGDYDADASQLARAQQLLTSAPVLRAQLFELLADPLVSSPIVPLTTSAAGQALVARIAALRSAFADDFAIAFSTSPALPASNLDGAAFDALLDAGTGFGYAPRNLQPRVGLGDVEGGIIVEAFRRQGNRSSLGGWVRATVRFPTGDPPSSGALLDQGTGDGQLDIELAATVEAARSRVGVRAEASFTRQNPADVETRVGSPLQALLPTRFRAAIRRDPGDIVLLSARPFVRLADHLAITGLAQYMHRGVDGVAYSDGQQPIVGAVLNDLTTATATSATRVGIGLSYSHDGVHRDGAVRMPVEASFAIERTVATGSGLVPAPFTSRVMLRFYKPITRR